MSTTLQPGPEPGERQTARSRRAGFSGRRRPKPPAGPGPAKWRASSTNAGSGPWARPQPKPPMGLEPMTSPLPRECSTTELRWHAASCRGTNTGPATHLRGNAGQTHRAARRAAGGRIVPVGQGRSTRAGTSGIVPGNPRDLLSAFGVWSTKVRRIRASMACARSERHQSPMPPREPGRG